MQKHFFLLPALVFGCASSDEPGDDNAPAFTVHSKEVTIAPGEEVTLCYYFHTPNTANLAVTKWASEMGAGSHHMIVFFGAANQPPDGTLSAEGCGGPGGGTGPVWVYASQTPTYAMSMPSDDGTGTPLAMVVPANQPAFIQIHYQNPSELPLTSTVKVDAYALPADTAFTPTAAFITYNASIDIPPNAVNDVESRTCMTPAGAKFWFMSTHAHKQAMMMRVKDGANVVFESGDWEHPGQRDFAAPYMSFASGKLTYECTYTNLGDNATKRIISGPSAATDEMCMSYGYYFPAQRPAFCYDDAGPF
jgi:hypothetical protein